MQHDNVSSNFSPQVESLSLQMLQLIKLLTNQYAIYYIQLNDNNLQNLFPTNTAW